MRRSAFLLALAIQLCCAVTPVDAFLLCVSHDGCVELELAVPGTERCLEVACDTAHAAAGAPHDCRDIPLLAHAFAPGQGASLELTAPLPALLPARALLPAAAPVEHTWRRASTMAPPRAAPHRVVVLQL